MLVGNKAEAEEIPLLKLGTDFQINSYSVFSLQPNQQENNQCEIGSSEPELTEDTFSDLSEEARKSENGTILNKERHKLGTNCVFYVKDKYPELPQGLWTLKDKEEKLVNSHEPVEGAVAITPEGGAGHVSIVLAVLDDGLIIEEGNFIHGYKTIRKISKDLPVGYYRVDNKDKI